MSDKVFEWTDELVREFVAHRWNVPVANLGVYIDNHMRAFKEEKQPKEDKDWEIISYINKPTMRMYEDGQETYGVIDKGHVYWAVAIIEKFPIHSVLRLSDNEVFSVGDIIEDGIGSTSKIIAFEVDKKWVSGICAVTDKARRKSIDIVRKAKKPLFTTEDGVDIFEGGECWIVEVFSDRISNRAIHWTEIVKSGMKEHERYFSTEAIASEYILLNKPCLSLNEIISHVDIGGLCELRLKELAKTKINTK